PQAGRPITPSFGRVEDGRGRLGHAATLRFPSPLVEPDVPISGIRLSDWLHREAHHGTIRGRRSRRSRPSSPWTTSQENRWVPRPATLCRLARPEAEVVRPAEQRPVQRIAHFEPWIVIAGHQQIANPPL